MTDEENGTRAASAPAAELESSLDRALKRLAARPDWKLECWGCGHVSEVPADPLRQEYVCDECGASTSYGVPQPRVTIVPAVDRRFVTTKFETGRGEKLTGVDITMARSYAAAIALEILSVTEPAAYRALVKLFAVARAPTAPPPSESVGAPAPAGEPPPPPETVRELPGDGLQLD